MKHSLRGSEQEGAANVECSKILMEEYNEYVHRTRRKLQELPRGSKSWWTLSRQLMQKKTSSTGIPALKSSDGSWILDSEKKADRFAEVFQSKCKMNDAEVNEYITISVTGHEQEDLPDVTTQQAMKGLQSLDESSATGPDLLPTRVLRRCAASLAAPVARLAQRILSTGLWPSLWQKRSLSAQSLGGGGGGGLQGMIKNALMFEIILLSFRASERLATWIL